MFNLFKKQKKYLEQTQTVAAMAGFLLDDTNSDLPTPFKEYLNIDKLDYSLFNYP